MSWNCLCNCLWNCHEIFPEIVLVLFIFAGPSSESGKKYSKTKTFRNSTKFEKGQKFSENSQNNRESKGESLEATGSQDKKTHPTRETREAYPTRENREGPTRETREGSSRETREGSNRETREAYATRETREGYPTREFRRTNLNFRLNEIIVCQLFKVWI